jgi:antitoxin component YwqK of YwqJK toxin-antitoxin module
MTFYFPSGKKEIEGNLVKGSRDGTWYYFNEDGSMQVQMLYAKG